MHTQAINSLPHGETPLLGRIIVDSTALFHLSTRILDASPVYSSRPLLEILSYLALHGFEVIVPEMVAFEVADVLREGRWPGVHFSEAQDKPLKKAIAAYLRNAEKTGYLKIEPPPEKDDSRAAIFIRRIGEIHSKKLPSNRKRGEIINTRREFEPTKNFGDVAAQQYLLHMENNEVPVFYFSDDGSSLTAAMSLRSDMRVYALPLRSFLDGVHQHDILSDLYFKPWEPYGLLFAIEKNLSANGKTLGLISKNIDPLGCEAFNIALSSMDRAKPAVCAANTAVELDVCDSGQIDIFSRSSTEVTQAMLEAARPSELSLAPPLLEGTEPLP